MYQENILSVNDKIELICILKIKNKKIKNILYSFPVVPFSEEIILFIIFFSINYFSFIVISNLLQH